MREIAICLVRLFDSSGAVRKPPALAGPLALTKWHGCSVVPSTPSLNQEIPFSGSEGLTQTSPQLRVAKLEKQSSSVFFCRSAAPPQLLLPLWDIQYE
jgi:hypothetical protein